MAHPQADGFVLHSNPMSRGRIARWMLEETGAPYEVVYHDFGEARRNDAVLKLNPFGKVPVLEHGARHVTETAAICAYLADAVPGAGLAPAPADRHAYYRSLFLMAGPVEAAIVDRALGLEHPKEKRATSQYGDFASAMAALEQVLPQREYICGDQFTAADVFVGAHIIWGLQFGTLEKRQIFETYAARLQERPAYKKANALDDAAMSRDAD